MITYQEYLKAVDDGKSTSFIQWAITEHKKSAEYLIAVDAENYLRRRNTTVCSFQRLIYDVAGRAQIDPVAANFKCASGFFKQIVTQFVQTLLANGVTFTDENTKSKIGGERFDGKICTLTRAALTDGIAFGFFDFDRIIPFRLTEFVPLWDEETGALMAGFRFWQIANNKPLRVDVYTIEGVQSFIGRNGNGLEPMEGNEQPRPYQMRMLKYSTGVTEYLDGVNYPTLPIVPIYGSYEKQSEIIGLKENIDAYDLTKSGLIDDISDMPLVYWTLENAGGMSEKDLAFWKDRINRNKVSMTDDEVKVTANSIGVPYQAQETMLTRLEKDIYNDSMALNTRDLSAGNVTATAIRAASEPLNNRLDELEDCVRDFIDGLLSLVGIDDTPSFSRSKITNQMEETQMILLARDYLDANTLRHKLPFLSTDEADAIPAALDAEAMDLIEPAEAVE